MKTGAVDLARAIETADALWADSALPALVDYIQIPAKSPAYDPQWDEHGHLRAAVELIAGWCRSRSSTGVHGPSPSRHPVNSGCLSRCP